MKNKRILKIGIVTYHRPINYGAILQVYALQKTIKKHDVECEIIDYRNSTMENKHKKVRLTDAKNVKQVIKNILTYRNHNMKYDKFRQFAEKNLCISRAFYDLDELVNIENEYDNFIVGSDQVWNYKINNMDPVYFLQFVRDTIKRNSYAASFGIKTIPEEHRNKYTMYLKDFNKILVRESQGATLVSELTAKDSSVVLDPTFLLSKEEWLQVSEEAEVNEEKYILVYAFGGSKHIEPLATNISKETGLKIKQIKNTYRKSRNISYIKSAGPSEFIKLINNAEYVITNSFHGSVFSIIFNKKFFVELLPSSIGTNSRLEDLLNLFSINDRIIDSSNSQVINKKIDYMTISKTLEIKKEESMEMLSKVIFGE